MFRSGVALVRVDAQLVQGKRALGNLTKADFRVLDEGSPREIEYFGHNSEPLWIVLLLDVSGSMNKRLDEMAAVARQTLRTLRPEDKLSVIFFGRESHLGHEFNANREDAAAVIGQGKKNKQVGAGININPAIIDSARYLREQAGNKPGRRAIVILTDNECLHYQVTDQQTIEALNTADSVLNAIVTPNAKPPEQNRKGVTYNPDFTPADVFKLSQATGGEILKASKTGETFQEMMQRIRVRYSLHYRAPEDTPGQPRRVEAQLSPAARQKLGTPVPEVRARKGAQAAMKCCCAIAAPLLLVAAGWTQEADSIIDSVTIVELNAQVTQGNRAVRNLTHQDFRVWDEGVASRVVRFDYSFALHRVALLLDISASLKERQTELAAVARQTLGAQDKLSVMVFDEHTDEAIAACARQLNELLAPYSMSWCRAAWASSNWRAKREAKRWSPVRWGGHFRKRWSASSIAIPRVIRRLPWNWGRRGALT